jgi:hypothetical protein
MFLSLSILLFAGLVWFNLQQVQKQNNSDSSSIITEVEMGQIQVMASGDCPAPGTFYFYTNKHFTGYCVDYCQTTYEPIYDCYGFNVFSTCTEGDCSRDGCPCLLA